MSIKCIALDLDRTTLNTQGKISDANRQAIMDAVNNGVHVVIASGRAFDTLPSDVVSIPGIEYAITGNGSSVYRIKGKECLRSYLLTPESVETVMQVSSRYPVTYEAFIDGYAFASREYIQNPVKFGATAQAIRYIQDTRTLKNDIVQFILDNKEVLESMDIIVRDADVKEELKQKILVASDEIYVTSSIKQLVEISYKDAGKKSGVQYVADLLGVRREEVAAFGDADNDVDMIEYAGCGIAMANASDTLLKAADHVTLHHDCDGVAYAFKNFLHVC